MLNPIAEIARHYFDVAVRRDAGRIAFELKTPWSRTPRTLAFFASDVELSIAHRAPGAWFSDEIRVRKIGISKGPLNAIARWRSPQLFSKDVGPLRFTVDTAERQLRARDAFNAESAEHCARNKDFVPSTCYTLDSRRISSGTVISNTPINKPPNSAGGAERCAMCNRDVIPVLTLRSRGGFTHQCPVCQAPFSTIDAPRDVARPAA